MAIEASVIRIMKEKFNTLIESDLIPGFMNFINLNSTFSSRKYLLKFIAVYE